MSYREFYLGKNQKYLNTILTQARIHGIPPEWLAAFIDAEIGGGQGPDAEWKMDTASGVGNSSAVGAGQMTRATWKSLGTRPWTEVNRIGKDKGHIDPDNKITNEEAFLNLRTDGDINIAGIADLMDDNATTLMIKMLRRKQHFDQLPPLDQGDLLMRSHFMNAQLALATRFPDKFKDEEHQGMAQEFLIDQFGGAQTSKPQTPQEAAAQAAARAAAVAKAQQWYAANGNDWVSTLDAWYRQKGDGSRFDPNKFLQLSPRGLAEGAGGDAPKGYVPWFTGLEPPEQRALDESASKGYAPWGGDKQRD